MVTDVEYSCLLYVVFSIVGCLFLVISEFSCVSILEDSVKWFVEVCCWCCLYVSELGFSYVMFSWLVVVLYMSLLAFSLVYLCSDVRILEFVVKYVWFLLSIWLIFSLCSILCCIVSWELLGVVSFFLIGHYVARSLAVRASHQALLFNKIGDYFTCRFVLCFVLIGLALYIIMLSWI